MLLTVLIESPSRIVTCSKYMGRVAGDNAAGNVLQALDRFAAPLAELREAGMRPQCRFPVHWEKAFAAPLPHLAVWLIAVISAKRSRA